MPEADAMSLIYKYAQDNGIGILTTDRTEVEEMLGRSMDDETWASVKPYMINIISQMWETFEEAVITKLAQLGMEPQRDEEDEDDSGYGSYFSSMQTSTTTTQAQLYAAVSNQLVQPQTAPSNHVAPGGYAPGIISHVIGGTGPMPTGFSQYGDIMDPNEEMVLLDDTETITPEAMANLFSTIDDETIAQTITAALEQATIEMLGDLTEPEEYSAEWFDQTLASFPHTTELTSEGTMLERLAAASDWLNEQESRVPIRLETTAETRDLAFETYGDEDRIANGTGYYSQLPLVVSNAVPSDEAWVIYHDNNGNETKVVIRLAPESE